MADEPIVPREELRATLSAGQELGPEYEREVLDRFAAELERRIEARLAERRVGGLHPNQKTVIVLGSLFAAIPLMAIASGAADLAGVIVVSAALVLVDVFVLRS